MGQMVTPDFSVCIPAYNDITAFKRCLTSVLQQDGVTVECIVSDDSTTDAIQEYIQSITDERVRYVHNKPGLGAPLNWNAALALATGDILTLLHQDDWYRFACVLEQVQEVMRKNKADVVICGRALYNQGRCLGEYAPDKEIQTHFIRDFPQKNLVVNRLGHPSVFFFGKALQSVMYDTSLCYFSDTEYYRRVMAAAQHVFLCPQVFVGIERGGALSLQCLADPSALANEFAYVFTKYETGTLGKGLAVSRFLSSHIRHWASWKKRHVLLVLARNLTWYEIAVVSLSMPFFFGHMLYRFAFRWVMKKPCS